MTAAQGLKAVNNESQQMTPKCKPKKKSSYLGRLFSIPGPCKLLKAIATFALLVIVAGALVTNAHAHGIKHENGMAVALPPSPTCLNHVNVWLEPPTPSYAGLPTTNAQLMERYDNLGLIGSGGGGSVYRAKEKNSGKEIALKVSGNMIGMQYHARSVSYLTDKGVTPHLTRTFDAYSSKQVARTTRPNSHFFVDVPEGTMGSSAQVLTMELMEGDLENKGFNAEERLIFKIQQIHTKELLRRHGITPSDSEKNRNCLYKTVDASDCFRGHSMIDFDYWKYNIDGHDIYIPRPTYMLKIADIDLWDLPRPFPARPSPADNRQHPLKTLVNRINIYDEFPGCEEQLAQWTQIPPQGTILDMDFN